MTDGDRLRAFRRGRPAAVGAPSTPREALLARCRVRSALVAAVALWTALPAFDRSGPLAADVSAQDHGARVDEAVAEVQDTIVRLREIIHQNPELGNREFKTAERG